MERFLLMEIREEPKQKDFKLYGVFTGVFVTALVLAPILASKFIAVGPLIISGATLIFPINFIFNDILTEVYGYQKARRIIWTGIGCSILSAVMFFIVGLLPSPDFWHNQDAYMQILGIIPRVVFASLFAYFFSEFTNSLVLSKMKYWHKGKRGMYQAWRFIASTIAGELVDSIIFITVGFAGTIPTNDLIITILTIWVAKTLYEVVLLPFSTRFANYVKKVEGVDNIDYPEYTNYNPFAIFSERYRAEVWS